MKLEPGSVGVQPGGALNPSPEEVAKTEKAMKQKMSKKGKLGLPPLLDKRRREYGCPDGMFTVQPVFDRIFVYQLPYLHESDEYYGSGLIAKPRTVQRRDNEESPRGILLSAGCKALDTLRSNGIDVGYIINFVRLSPWRMVVDNIAGHDFAIMILHAGDVTGSEDLRSALKQGTCKIDTIEHEDGSREHVYVDKNNKVWHPTQPWMDEEY